MEDLQRNSVLKKTTYEGVGIVQYQEFYFGPSKPIIDKIDAILSEYYDFTKDELDYLINYDIKFRLGAKDDTEDSD